MRWSLRKRIRTRQLCLYVSITRVRESLLPLPSTRAQFLRQPELPTPTFHLKLHKNFPSWKRPSPTIGWNSPWSCSSDRLREKDCRVLCQIVLSSGRDTKQQQNLCVKSLVKSSEFLLCINKPAAPPMMWTGPAPAKSRTPMFLKNPCSPQTCNVNKGTSSTSPSCSRENPVN